MPSNARIPAGHGVAATLAVALLRQYAEMQRLHEAPDPDYINMVADELVADWKALEASRDEARKSRDKARGLAARYLDEMWKAQAIAEEIQERVSVL